MESLEVKMVQMEPSGPGAPKGRSKYAKMVPREAPRSPWGPPEGPKGAQEGPG